MQSRKYPTRHVAPPAWLTGLLAGFALLLLLSPTLSVAQPGGNPEGSGGWESGSAYAKLYDSQTLETIEGKIISIQKIIPQEGMSYGVNLLVKSGGKTISVHLGPSWYIDNQDFKIEAKDNIVVTGSRVSHHRKEFIIANEVTIGNRVMKLRNEEGYPVWSGWTKN